MSSTNCILTSISNTYIRLCFLNLMQQFIDLKETHYNCKTYKKEKLSTDFFGNYH